MGFGKLLVPSTCEKVKIRNCKAGFKVEPWIREGFQLQMQCIYYFIGPVNQSFKLHLPVYDKTQCTSFGSMKSWITTLCPNLLFFNKAKIYHIYTIWHGIRWAWLELSISRQSTIQGTAKMTIPHRQEGKLSNCFSINQLVR